MKPQTLLIVCYLFPCLALAQIPSEACRIALTTQDISLCKGVTFTDEDAKWIRKAETKLRQSGEKGLNEAWYQLAHLVIYTKDVAALNRGSATKRYKKGLFYFVMAADDNHPKAIVALSEYVKSKMEEGKIPIRYSHYLTYVQMDWALKGKSDNHHYAQYERWLAQVEQTRLYPQRVAVKTVVAMAQDYENGYFLGLAPDDALKLYQVAAKRGDALGQFKAGDLLYETNQALALTYLQQSAANQSADAMLRLGDHFGCLGNKEQALKWYEKALSKGNEFAADEKASVLETGKPSQCK